MASNRIDSYEELGKQKKWKGGGSTLFARMMSERIRNKEVVFILDPNGDTKLRQSVVDACVEAGRPGAFKAFLPAFPEKSIRYDPIRNFASVEQLADGLAALGECENGVDPYTSTRRQALKHICHGLATAYPQPSLMLFKGYLESGPDEMVMKALIAHADRENPHGRNLASDSRRSSNRNGTAGTPITVLAFYEAHIAPTAPSPELEGLISLLSNDRIHFTKVVAGLLPIIGMLIESAVGKLLSPNYSDIDDQREILTAERAIAETSVVYFALDNFADGMLGNVIESILVSDIQAASCESAKSDDIRPRVNVFIDRKGLQFQAGVEPPL